VVQPNFRESKSQVTQLQEERSVVTSIKEPNNVARHFTYELSEESTAKWRATSASSISQKLVEEQFLAFSTESFAGVLAQCPALAHLDLFANGIGDSGAERLAGVLGQCPALAHCFGSS
jgi:hypothetical protein